MIKSENGRVTATGKYSVILTDIANLLDAVVVETARAIGVWQRTQASLVRFVVANLKSIL